MMTRLKELAQGLRQGLRSVFVRNFHLKAIALLLTFALYLWVGEDRETQIIASAPLQFSVPKDQMLVEPTIDQVKVTLRGQWSTLSDFDQSNLKPVVVELDEEDDERMVPITAESVQIPPGLRVVSIEPSFVRVDLEETTSRDLPVEPRIVGRTRNAHEIGQIAVTPESVTAVGPESVLDDLESLPTEPIDVTGRVRSFEKQVQLRPENPLINYRYEGAVMVSVPIRAEEIERTLEGIRVEAVNTTQRTKISPASLDVTVQGPRSTVEQLVPEAIHAVVDLGPQKNSAPGRFEKEAEIRNLPSEVELIEVHPTHFVVETFEREQTEGSDADEPTDPGD